MPRTLSTCTTCGGSVVRGRVTYASRVRQHIVPIDGEFLNCTSCGEVFFTPSEADDVSDRVAAKVRQEEGLLQPAEIRALRARLGMTQDEFEAFLGVGPKTVTRWEKGTVYQNKATDTLLRLLAEVPEAVHHLRQWRAQAVRSSIARS